jgi:hypothetical protein
MRLRVQSLQRLYEPVFEFGVLHLVLGLL